MNGKLEKWVSRCEKANRGWVIAGEVPPCVVTVDGREIKHVAAVHRKTGRVKVYRQPLMLDRYKKHPIMKTVRGERIRMEPITHGER